MSQGKPYVSHGCLTCQWGSESFSVLCSRVARAGRRQVTLLQRPRNNGLFFPGSLLHPHHCPPIGPQSLSVHRHRKLWQTAPTFSTNRGPAYRGDSFSKALSLTNSGFSSFGRKMSFCTQTRTQNVCLNNELKTVYVTMSQKPKGKFSWPTECDLQWQMTITSIYVLL